MQVQGKFAPVKIYTRSTIAVRIARHDLVPGDMMRDEEGNPIPGTAVQPET